MPHRSALYHAPGVHPSTSGLVRTPRATAAVAQLVGDFTFAHAGRQLRIGPIAFWIVVGTLVIMAAWSITTATYFAFREDVLTRLVSREAEMQFGYEDRIAELRAQIDRLSSRQLLDQEQYQQKLDQLLHRQAALESRSNALGTVADPTTTGSIKLPAHVLGNPPPRGASLKPSPLGDGAALAPSAGGRSAAKDSDSLDGMLTSVQASLDRVDARQRAQLNSLAETYDSRLQRMRGVLADLGIDAAKIAPAKSGLGGPFVPVIPAADASGFDRALTRINIERAQVESLNRTLVNVPLRKPMVADGEIMSGFGVRIDPFNSRPAMHTGLDIRADIGDPIHATAGGTVTVAGWTGGYGKMVEINHGNGFATRYGHMSEIDVQVGQPVKIGQVLGKVGTTGRSTGPHLHYETRIDGEAVDPQKFLHAGARLAEGQ
jgi:murein DD-endopeptidase MepM/ murein hydrolase activator NlpD